MNGLRGGGKSICCSMLYHLQIKRTLPADRHVARILQRCGLFQSSALLSFAAGYMNVHFGMVRSKMPASSPFAASDAAACNWLLLAVLGKGEHLVSWEQMQELHVHLTCSESFCSRKRPLCHICSLRGLCVYGRSSIGFRRARREAIDRRGDGHQFGHQFSELSEEEEELLEEEEEEDDDVMGAEGGEQEGGVQDIEDLHMHMCVERPLGDGALSDGALSDGAFARGIVETIIEAAYPPRVGRGGTSRPSQVEYHYVHVLRECDYPQRFPTGLVSPDEVVLYLPPAAGEDDLGLPPLQQDGAGAAAGAGVGAEVGRLLTSARVLYRACAPMRMTHWSTHEVLLAGTHERPQSFEGAPRILIDKKDKTMEQQHVLRKLLEQCVTPDEARAVYDTVYFFRRENGPL